jgi:hypothetical protein
MRVKFPAREGLVGLSRDEDKFDLESSRDTRPDVYGVGVDGGLEGLLTIEKVRVSVMPVA